MRGGLHELYATEVTTSHQLKTLSAYAVHRPDGLWSVLFINKDPERAYKVDLRFESGGRKVTHVGDEPLELFQYSPAQYTLSYDASHPVPTKNDPPVSRPVSNDSIELPAYSLTVLRGRMR